MKTAKAFALTVTAIAVLASAACSDDDDDGAPPPSYPPASSTSSSGYTTAPSAPHSQVSCTSRNVVNDPTSACSCTVTSPSPAGASAIADYSGSVCAEPWGGWFQLDYICCADESYPGSGSCDCAVGGVGPYGCEDNGTWCDCGWVQIESQPKLTECTPTSPLSKPGGGSKEHCCMEDLGRCSCQLYDSCSDGDVEVPSCSTPERAPKYRTECGPGKKKVTFCSPEKPVSPPPSSSSSSGGTSSSGAASSSGSTQTCDVKFGDCDDSGDCTCGASCFASAVCTTCQKRCGYSCAGGAAGNEYCQGLQAKLHLNVGFTSCVKTSPNFEIYKCQ